MEVLKLGDTKLNTIINRREWQRGRAVCLDDCLLGIVLLIVAQVMISGFLSKFELCIRLCAEGLEPAWDSLFPSLCPSPACALSLSQNE